MGNQSKVKHKKIHNYNNKRVLQQQKDRKRRKEINLLFNYKPLKVFMLFCYCEECRFKNVGCKKQKPDFKKLLIYGLMNAKYIFLLMDW